MKRFIFYLIRWQLSTPILWLVVKKMGVGLWPTVIANLIGGAIFFWIDRFIFTSAAFEVWHTKDQSKCDKCARVTSVWRLVKTKDYDRSQAEPKFLCTKCSREKLKELKKRGINTGHTFLR